jgi:cytochrome b561
VTQKRYSMGAMVLHWVIAIAVIANWRIAEGAEHASREAAGAIMAQHKALGMTILALSLLRLVWRLAKRPPPLAVTLQPWEAKLARLVHTIFYVLLIGLPLGGWLANSMYGQGVDVFGLFTIPALPAPQDKDLGHEIFEVHGALAHVMLLLVALHVLGALKHHFLDKDGNLYRMLPYGKPKG